MRRRRLACPSDYKALVCIFLFGGNDGNNTVIPISTPKSNPNNSYANYAAVRGGLALPQASLNMVNTLKWRPIRAASRPDGDCQPVQQQEERGGAGQRREAGDAADASGVPAEAKAIPLNLFSHLDQQTEWQTSVAQGFATTGWGGRLADAMQSCNSGKLPMIVSVGGNALFATGAQTNPRR